MEGGAATGFAEGDEPVRDAAPTFTQPVLVAASAAATIATTVPAAMPAMLQFKRRRRHRRPGVGHTATQQEGNGKEGKYKTGHFHEGLLSVSPEILQKACQKE